MRSFLLTIIMLSHFFLLAQDRINYQHRSIDRSIKKMNDSEVKRILLHVNIKDQASPINGRFYEVLSGETEKQSVKYLYVGRVYSCRAGGCSLTSETNEPESSQEYFDYFILYDKECAVKLVKVYNYQATHGYEIGAKGWLRQFDDHTPNKKLTVGKQIDAISGATISVYGITNDIDEKSRFLAEILQSRFNKKHN